MNINVQLFMNEVINDITLCMGYKNHKPQPWPPKDRHISRSYTFNDEAISNYDTVVKKLKRVIQVFNNN